MIDAFLTLRDDEIEIIMNAPAIVAILIAGADNDVDKDETAKAISYATKAGDDYDKLKGYFEEVSSSFEETFKTYMRDLPMDLETRQHAITSYLRQLNGVLPKVGSDVAVQIHRFLLGLAKAVAMASGGVFGIKKISKAEAEYVGLPMIEDPAAHGR